MDIQRIINQIKHRSDFDKVGMVLAHNGVVRGTSRDGRKVSGLKVSVDHEKLEQILEKERQTPGILDIIIEIAEDRHLSVGDDVMVLVVAGDIRDTVITVLERTLNAVKTTVTSKTEFFI
ncbi:MAG: molybdenum cofactor biosynthesis protein MoaE [Desulfobacteraceae bacterium]|nr:molybdenum cofactor biosynthesis protein MoaE [Desulfobacteraceae bacterium]MBC2757627.1 molybdenum cofactor biosynthesis protein MoaE [Desulfobacteraceae bacterium]